MNYAIKFYGEDNYFLDLDCFDIKPNMYKINPYGIIINNNNHIMSQVYNKLTGYVSTSLRTVHGTQFPYLIHRLVAKTFCSNPLNKNIVNHIDCNTTNNYYRNLEWCTQKENMQHAILLGRYNVIGEDNATARFTNEQIHQICKLMSIGKQYKYILEYMNLEINDKNLDILTKIRSKHIWKHISDLYDIPEKEYRSPAINYSNEQINTICRMISEGYSNRYISYYLNIDMNDKKESDKFYKFVTRIRNRQTYTHISQYYNW